MEQLSSLPWENRSINYFLFILFNHKGATLDIRSSRGEIIKVWHDKCIYQQFFVYGVKKDAMVFILPKLNLTFWVLFFIWYSLAFPMIFVAFLEVCFIPPKKN